MKKGVQAAAAAAHIKKIWSLNMKESAKELKTRHEYMVSLNELEQLMIKMNPGEFDLYEAAKGDKLTRTGGGGDA